MQQLKDGIKLGAQLLHRSDSTNETNEVNTLREIINKEIGGLFIEKEIIYREKSKFVQQGHEEATPTQLHKKPDDEKELNNDQFKLMS